MAFNHMDKDQEIASEMREYYFQDFEIDMKLSSLVSNENIGSHEIIIDSIL